MSHETEKQKVKEFVKQWMDSHEPDTFVKNKYDAFIYTAKHSSLNLVLFFESLLEDYIDEKNENLIPVSDCCSAEMIPPDLDMEEQMGSMYRAAACYICKKCNKVCEPKNQDL